MQFVPGLIFSPCFITLDKLRPGSRGEKGSYLQLESPNYTARLELQLMGADFLNARAVISSNNQRLEVNVTAGLDKQNTGSSGFSLPELCQSFNFCADPPGRASLGEKQGLGFGSGGLGRSDPF